MLVVEKCRLTFFLPLVERTVVGLPQSFAKLLQTEFGLLQADWVFAL
jgi:hypothetical protein